MGLQAWRQPPHRQLRHRRPVRPILPRCASGQSPLRQRPQFEPSFLQRQRRLLLRPMLLQQNLLPCPTQRPPLPWLAPLPRLLIALSRAIGISTYAAVLRVWRSTAREGYSGCWTRKPQLLHQALLQQIVLVLLYPQLLPRVVTACLRV